MDKEQNIESTESNRRSLKSDRWEEWKQIETDQRKGISPLPPEKPYSEGATLIDLTASENLALGEMPLVEAIRRRRSRRQFAGEPLTLDELAFLLWATQGVSKVFAENAASLRTVPSGGARHSFETYLMVNRVAGLEPGLYRYLPLEHKLCFLRQDIGLVDEVDQACNGQYVRDSAVVFIWTVIPYRTEWRYTFLAPKIIAMYAGHLCQNLYLASEAIGAGTCAIGAYDQLKMDAVLGVDGVDEFAIYAAPVGKIT
ncbi:MAG: SagB/ThcOx family dehydrogenase [Anaerolineae bacterium]|nr:SagB/ThcOx family dehydrogenase [Anaerolineae bacterium]